MGTSLLKNKKILLTLLVAVVIVGATIVMQFVDDPEGEVITESTLDPAFLFYRDLGVQFRDCGSEELNLGFGYNKKMRTCFEDAHTSCVPTKLHQKISTIEGDPIFTTLVIEGVAPEGCAVHIYVDNRDRFGSVGKIDTVCYSTTYDASSGQDSFLFTECENNTTQYFY